MIVALPGLFSYIFLRTAIGFASVTLESTVGSVLGKFGV